MTISEESWGIIVLALTVAAGGVIAWIMIWGIWAGNRARQKLGRKIRCLFGSHATGPVKGEVGGRNVQRCLYCDKIVYEYKVSKDSVRRIY